MESDWQPPGFKAPALAPITTLRSRCRTAARLDRGVLKGSTIIPAAGTMNPVTADRVPAWLTTAS